MANPRIEVEIGAKVDGLSTGVNQATSQLSKLENAVNQATPEINKLTRATSQYNSVGTDFARIIQDAPFGIIGVGNNITQLAGSFQTLKNQTGSTSQALKTAFASIFSSGNALILGISALTTVFTVLQMKGFFKTEESAKSLKERLDEYKDTLDDLSRANLEGASNAQKEIQNLTLLRKQAENTAVSQEKRLDAVNQLQKQYPDFLGNISKETILNGQADVAYKNVTQSILAKAKAQASANQIAQNAIQILTLETKLEETRAKRLAETSSAQAQIDALIKKRQDAGFLTQGEIQLYDQLISRINKANETLSEDEELLKEKLRLLQQNVKLEENVTSLIESGATFTNETNKAKKESIKLEDELIQKIEFSNKLREDSFKKLEQLAKSINKEISLKEVDVKTPDAPPQKDVADDGPANLQIFTDKVKQGLIQSNDIFSQLLDNFREFKGLSEILNGDSTLEEKLTAIGKIGQSVADSFGAIGNAISNSFSDGNKALGQFLGTLVSFAGKLIAEYLSISLASSVASASQSAQATGPAAIFTLPTFIAGALALVGSAFATIGKGGRSRGGASVGTSGLGAGTSFSGGATGFGFAQNREIRGELVARGQDLVYVFNEANTRINKG